MHDFLLIPMRRLCWFEKSCLASAQTWAWMLHLAEYKKTGFWSVMTNTQEGRWDMDCVSVFAVVPQIGTLLHT